MSSLRKLASCRLNGARSKGPVTEAGRRTASRNAMRHGLLARVTVLSCEGEDGFQALIEEHLALFDAPDGVEFGLIEEMVSAQWRMRRAWAIERQMLEGAFAAESHDDPTVNLAAAFRKIAVLPEFALLHRYETRLHLVYQRALNNLVMLRNAEMPNEPNPANEQLPEPLQPGPCDSPQASPACPESAPPSVTPVCTPRATGPAPALRPYSKSKRALRRAKAKLLSMSLRSAAAQSAGAPVSASRCL